MQCGQCKSACIIYVSNTSCNHVKIFEDESQIDLHLICCLEVLLLLVMLKAVQLTQQEVCNRHECIFALFIVLLK
ncbi:hypothetical protein D917_06223 [Trichinella nativa]|uniref:Uncharacterized protein n=1 Tax=Trichinella nativa TaxID=6335 RepID=A0A1Y3EY10_9BILA|nr:hypothetical protein D917_06223 [Trichinella nativa]